MLFKWQSSTWNISQSCMNSKYGSKKYQTSIPMHKNCVQFLKINFEIWHFLERIGKELGIFLLGVLNYKCPYWSTNKILLNCLLLQLSKPHVLVGHALKFPPFFLSYFLIRIFLLGGFSFFSLFTTPQYKICGISWQVPCGPTCTAKAMSTS